MQVSCVHARSTSPFSFSSFKLQHCQPYLCNLPHDFLLHLCNLPHDFLLHLCNHFQDFCLHLRQLGHCSVVHLLQLGHRDVVHLLQLTRCDVAAALQCLCCCFGHAVVTAKSSAAVSPGTVVTANSSVMVSPVAVVTAIVVTALLTTIAVGFGIPHYKFRLGKVIYGEQR